MRREIVNDLTNELDPRGLIRDSYVIERITETECRSIFLDWVIFDDHELPQKKQIEHLLNHYGKAAPGHPMTRVLTSALEEAATPKRRGGRKGRLG